MHSSIFESKFYILSIKKKGLTFARWPCLKPCLTKPKEDQRNSIHITFKNCTYRLFEDFRNPEYKPMGLYSGGLIFGMFFCQQNDGLIFGGAYIRGGLLSGFYGILHFVVINHCAN